VRQLAFTSYPSLNVHVLNKQNIILESGSAMANTYTQLYLHIVFAVKYRAALLQPPWDDRLRLYITAIVQNNGHKMLAVNNMPDHLHLFIGLNPAQSISDIMRLVKGDSSEWINKEGFTSCRFQWQEGYGAFSHSKSQLDSVVKYIHNQHEHHKKVSFKDEYIKILDNFGIDYEDRYLFLPPQAG
jgi:putative transposase